MSNEDRIFEVMDELAELASDSNTIKILEIHIERQNGTKRTQTTTNPTIAKEVNKDGK